MQEKWNQFVYYLLADKEKGVEEADYHNTIEVQLQLLGWTKYNNEICHKPNLHMGNSGSIQPDILVQKDNKNLFVIEVKQPLHIRTDKDRDQLASYMRQLKLSVGIYIGENIEIFYDQPDREKAVSVLTIPLELNNMRGVRFVELFSKERFDKEVIIKFCEERIKEMLHKESLNKIKNNLINDSQNQITEALKMYLMEKHGNTFSKNDIDGMLASLNFMAMPNNEQKPVTFVSTPKQTSEADKPKRQNDYTKYSLNGGQPLCKNHFVHQLVKMYVEQHPKATFSELEQVFEPKLQGGSYGVIRRMANIPEKDINGTHKRYFVKEDEILRSFDGCDFAVCNQWKDIHVLDVVDLARKLGFTVTSSADTKDVSAKASLLSDYKDDKNIPCVLKRNSDAKGLFNTETLKLIVLKGSKINPHYFDSIETNARKKREDYIAKYAERKGDDLVLMHDVSFDSPSGAAQFCIGGSVNGWKVWKDENNKELGIYRR